MTREDRQLLLKDLCSRLPYGVKGTVEVEVSTGEYSIESGHLIFVEKENDVELLGINKDTEEIEVYSLNNNIDLSEYDYTIDGFKPYLRPMSSMTEEEKQNLLNRLFDKEAKDFYIDDEGFIDGKTSYLIKEGLNYPAFCTINVNLYTDWLNSNHFDYRGLIPKGLAIEAPKDMYK